MDSMRSLNTSLPGNTSVAAKQERPEQLLSAFKAAALSVTNLYKSAAADQGRARAEGYQDALDELLGFLDKNDIGLSDGEGWRIRRWATERLDGRDSVSHTESDDENSDKADRGSSPVIQRSQSASQAVPPMSVATTVSPAARTEAAHPPSTVITSPSPGMEGNMMPPQAPFTFRSSHEYPKDTDVILSDVEGSDNPFTSHSSNTASSRTSRSRNGNHAGRNSARASTTLGRTGGQKRKINFGDFFDIGNLGQGRDGFGGGGKRGRFA